MKARPTLIQALRLALIASMASMSFLGSLVFAQGRLPDVPSTPLSEAQAALERRDWTSAEALLSPLVKTEPKNPFAYFELAQLYENTNRTQAAKNIYQAI